MQKQGRGMNNAYKLDKTYYDIIFHYFQNASPFVRGHPHRERKNRRDSSGLLFPADICYSKGFR